MTMAAVNRAPRPSSLADVLDVVLDKGIVIDAYVRVALVGIELLTIDARIVIASVDTYLRFAEAVNRLDLQPSEQVAGLPGLMDEMRGGGARSKTRGALTGAKEKAQDFISDLTGGDQDDEDDDEDDGGRGNGSSRRDRDDRDDRDDRRAPASRRARQRG
jgi:gas vesicle structural protein